jgi:hypothetical protein
MDDMKWIVLTYTLPAEPSRPRVAVWRALRKAGAVSIQQSMWALPDCEDHVRTLRKICAEIEANRGEALMMESTFFEKEHERRVTELFSRMRDEEYSEFIEECGKYLKEIEKEIAREKFTFAELEEEEAEHEKLTAWFKKIEARDLFGASLREKAVAQNQMISEAIENYSKLVFEHDMEDKA